MGYHRAGFDVVGVDINPQPHYPFEFIQADAMTYPLEGFDVIHASPPCQAYSKIVRNVWHRSDDHPDLVAPTRDRLITAGVPYVIENVEGAPIRASVMLCGTMFGLNIRKHRWFETHGVDIILAPASCGDHRKLYNPWKSKLPDGSKNSRTIVKFRAAQDTPWIPMGGGNSRKEGITGDVFNAIPPAYTRWIGEQLMRVLRPDDGDRLVGSAPG